MQKLDSEVGAQKTGSHQGGSRGRAGGRELRLKPRVRLTVARVLCRAGAVGEAFPGEEVGRPGLCLYGTDSWLAG